MTLPARAGADPATLEALAGVGPGESFTLDRRLRDTALAVAGYHHACDHLGRVDAAAVVALGAALVDAALALDRWTLAVAEGLRAVDSGDALAVRAALRAGVLDLDALATVGADRRLRLPLRSRAWRAAATLHATALQLAAHRVRAAAAASHAARPLHERVLAGVERFLVDHLLRPLAPVLDLEPDGPDRVARRLEADAEGLRSLLAEPGLTWLSVRRHGTGPDRRTTARVALGDPTSAAHLVVLVPGTGSGVANHGYALDDARALHAVAQATTTGTARPGGVATVLDLHEAPPTLAQAAARDHAAVAAPRLAAAVADLARSGTGVTVVGHSHGAVVAGAAAHGGMPADRLVLLGAPGASGAATTRAEDLLPRGSTWVGLAPLDPIALVPLLGGRVQHGPLPSDPSFGARRLALDGRHLSSRPTLHAPAVTGHLRYLEPGSFALANVARIAVGLQPWPPPGAAAGSTTTRTTAVSDARTGTGAGEDHGTDVTGRQERRRAAGR